MIPKRCIVNLNSERETRTVTDQNFIDKELVSEKGAPYRHIFLCRLCVIFFDARAKLLTHKESTYPWNVTELSYADDALL